VVSIRELNRKLAMVGQAARFKHLPGNSLGELILAGGDSLDHLHDVFAAGRTVRPCVAQVLRKRALENRKYAVENVDRVACRHVQMSLGKNPKKRMTTTSTTVPTQPGPVRAAGWGTCRR